MPMRLQLATVCVSLVLGTQFTFGQTPPPPPPGSPSATQAAASAARQASERQAFSDAKALAKAGSVAAAEQRLLQVNLHATGTAAWERESGGRLLQLVAQLRASAQFAPAGTLAASALLHVQNAASMASTPRERAAAKAAAGMVYERFLGDAAQALANYQAALDLVPTSTNYKLARDRMARITSLTAKVGGAQ